MHIRAYNRLQQLCLAISIFVLFAVPAAAQPLPEHAAKVVSPGGYQVLQEKASSQNALRLIVSLHVEAAPAEAMTDEEVNARQHVIRQVQDAVVNRMQGRNMSRLHAFRYVPQILVSADQQALNALLSDPDVAAVEEDIPVPHHLDVSVPLIGAPGAWSQGYTGAGVTVAILDTGVDKTHPMLAGVVVSEACYSSSGTDGSVTWSSLCPGGALESIASGSAMPYASGVCPLGDCDHGTHVAGIAVGRNNGSFSGVAKGANVIAIQVFTRFDNASSQCGSSGSPCALTFSSDYRKGLERVYELRNTYTIAAVNMSLGGGEANTSFCDGSPTKPYIDNLRSAGIATVISSGNDGYTTGLSSPACISTAVSVGATTDADAVWFRSNSASYLSLLAPGSSIQSAIPNIPGVPPVPGGQYQFMTGTSMAAPHVTGTWAILKQANPALSVDQVLNGLQTTGLNVVDSRNGISKPRIRVDAALNALVCSFTLTPAVSAPFPLAGGPGSFTVTTLPGCAWTATSAAPWVAITGGFSGVGSGTVTYTVGANTAYGRAAAITVGTKSHLVKQVSVPGVTGIGVYANASWYLDMDRSSVWEGIPTDASPFFGFPGAVPVAGDWNGSGTAKAGVYANGSWYLDANGSGAWNGVPADRFAFFGFPGAIPVAGDWDGAGTDKVAVYANASWYFDTDGSGLWEGVPTDTFAFFGFPGAVPVAGKWSGVGPTRIGVYADEYWYLDVNGNGVWDGAQIDALYHFGFSGVIPVVGDWNGDGRSKIGVYHNGTWYLDLNGNGVWDGVPTDGLASFGFSGAVPVTGNW